MDGRAAICNTQSMEKIDWGGADAAEAEGEEHEGQRYLEMLGLGDFGEQEITATKADGSKVTVQTRDFVDICGEDALDSLAGLEGMGEALGVDHPEYTDLRGRIRDHVAQRLGIVLPAAPDAQQIQA
jgi:hypothetical protein